MELTYEEAQTLMDLIWKQIERNREAGLRDRIESQILFDLKSKIDSSYGHLYMEHVIKKVR